MSGYGSAAAGGYDELGAPTARKPLPTALRFVAALVLLVLLDLVWIQLITKKLLGLDYFSVVQQVQNAPIAGRWQGLLAYLSLGYAAAFMTEGATPKQSALLGARIGFIIYSVFDFTSTFLWTHWSLKVAVLDTVWGTLLYTATGYLLHLLTATTFWQRL